MRRHELWRQQYRLSGRYMQHLKEEELQQRARDVFNNLIQLNHEPKISLPVPREGEKWMILWTHVLEEFVIRFGPFPSGFENGFMKNMRIPDTASTLAKRVC